MKDLELHLCASLYSLPPRQNVLAVHEDLAGDLAAVKEAKFSSPVLNTEVRKV